jgi:hypothetical protein
VSSYNSSTKAAYDELPDTRITYFHCCHSLLSLRVV